MGKISVKKHIRKCKKKVTIVRKHSRKKKTRGAMSSSTIKYIKSKGGKIYLVGGKVRDSVAGLKSKDTDYLVTGIPHSRLQELLSKRGDTIVDRNMGVIKFRDALVQQKEPDDVVLPRLERPTGGGKHRDFEIKYDERLPIKTDLKRRDFTINAMAMDAETGEIIDPFGGKKDLMSKKIRLVDKGAFKDDPLRMLRAGQFASRIDGDITEETLAAMERNKKLIHKITPERISDEFRKGFAKGKAPEKMIEAFMKTGLLQEIIPETKDIVGFDQKSKYHKYNLDKHTLEVVKNIKAIDDLTEKKSAHKQFTLGMAALLHDIGKPATAKPKGENLQFIGHADKSAEMAKQIVDKLKLSTSEKKDIIFYIKNHHLFLSPDISDKKVRQAIDKYGLSKIKDLLTFREADMLASGKPPYQVKLSINLLNEKVIRNAPITYSIKDLKIGAKELMDTFKVPQGKEIGQILELMHKAVLSNPNLNTEGNLLQFIPKKYIDKRVKKILYNRDYRKRPEVKEMLRKYVRSPKVKARNLEYSKKPDVIERQKEYVDKNRDKINAKRREWYAKNRKKKK